MSEDKRTKICFLLGAGFSKAAGLPDTRDLTQYVLSEIKHTPCKSLIETIRRRLLAYKKERHPDKWINSHFVSYEDIFNAIDQLLADDTGTYENPLLRHVQSQLRAKIIKDIKIETSAISETSNFARDDYAEELNESLRHLRKLVAFRLSQLPEPPLPKYGNVVIEALQDNGISISGIFTLNHDLLLERYLEANNLPFNNGMAETISTLPKCFLWDIVNYGKVENGVPIVHLHGHLELYWVRIRHRVTNRLYYAPGRPANPDPSIGDRSEEFECHSVESAPFILIGTTNKMIKYHSNPLMDMQCYFRTTLESSSRLIVCGYSFCDHGINTRIFEWLWRSSQRQMVVIEPNPKGLREGLRANDLFNWNDAERGQQLLVVPKCVEDVCLDEIRGGL